MAVINTLSKILGPGLNIILKNPVSLSQKLFNEFGLVYFNNGVGTIMPLLLRSLRKLEVMVRKEMKEISALEVMLPALISSKLFETSGRINLPDLFEVPAGDNKSFVLSPTCEEAMARLLQTYKLLHYKDFPIRLYQISNKFRKEKRPRSGLLRANEFLMKDLYCFDVNEESCEQCYQEVINQYHHFFNLLQVPYVCAEASTGDIGGLKSHEFHFLTKAGQDKLVTCNNCGHNENIELQEGETEAQCRKCQSNNVSVCNAIEVGHAFKLGTKFTEPFEVKYQSLKQTYEIPQMSSFGLGLTRILAACVDVLSTSNEIRWPVAIAPYLVCVLPPKSGSHEEAVAKDTAQIIYHQLNDTFQDEVIMDDRTSQAIGKRMNYNKKIGFPFQVILGKNLHNNPPTVEVFDLSTGSVDYIQIPDVNQFILDKMQGNFEKQNYKKESTA